MRSTALAFKDEYDEVPVSSQEILERDVGAIRADLNELKADFRAAVKRLDERIDAAVAKLEAEIRALAARAEWEVQQLATRMETQLAEMREENKSLREKVEKNTESIVHLDKTVHAVETKVDLLIWFVGILGALIMGVVGVGSALRWF